MKSGVAGLFIGVAVVLFVAMNISYASVPQLITVQGKLLNVTDGEPFTGVRNLTFSIWDSVSGGNMLYWENHTVDLGSDGTYQVVLGSTSSLDLAFDEQYYLEIEVNGTTLSPRSAMASKPTTYRTMVAEDVQCNGACLNESEFEDRAVTLEDFYCITEDDGAQLPLMQNTTVNVSGICTDTDGCDIRVEYQPQFIAGSPSPSWGHYQQWSGGYYRFVGFERGSATIVSHTGTNDGSGQAYVVDGAGQCDVWDDGSEGSSQNDNLTVYTSDSGCHYYFCD